MASDFERKIDRVEAALTRQGYELIDNPMADVEKRRAAEHSVSEQVAVEMVARGLAAHRDSTSDDVRRIGAHGNNKITTAFYVLERVAAGDALDGELLGLASGALADLKELNHVFRAMQGRK